MTKRGAFALLAGLGVGVGLGFGVARRQPAVTASVHDAGTHASAPQQLWTCGMHPQVIQDHPGTCPICGMVLTPLDAGSEAARPSSERTIRYWWDPMMNPPYIADRPGKSPMGMDLVPVYEGEVAAGSVLTIDPAVVQNMGVRTTLVVAAPLHMTVRAVGYLREPEPSRVDVNLRVSGWVERLSADTDGMHVHAGAPLFELYSPELRVAIEELIAARKAHASGASDGAGGTAVSLFESARQKLELLGLTRAQVDRYAALDRAPATVPILSPITGHVMEKMVVAGAAVKAGDPVFRLSDRSTMWLDLQVYEQDLAFVRQGEPVAATIAILPGQRFDGRISFVHPHVDPTTRTGLARVVLANESGLLRQGMYATAELRTELTPRAILVPREAVIDTGTRQIAFVVLDGGHFEPRTVKMGVAADDGMVQVLEGLAPGESVVVSGQFLLDAESRLREAIRKHLQLQREARHDQQDH